MKYIVLTLLIVSIPSMSAIAIFWIVLKTPGVDIEIVKALLGILAAAVIAQVVALVVSQYTEEKKVQAERDLIRAGVLERLNKDFIELKALRRHTRGVSAGAIGKVAVDRIEVGVYQELMERVSNIQLSLEIIAKDVETWAHIFAEAERTYESISRMEEYLNSIVNEWEGVHAFDLTQTVDAAALPRLGDLVGEYRTSQFRGLFVHNYYAAVERVRRSMSEGKSRQWKIAFGASLQPAGAQTPSGATTNPIGERTPEDGSNPPAPK